jgi:hypothetical protein
MTKRRLIAAHAEDVGGVIVEPGGELPDDVDDEVLERLEADGKLGDAEAEKSRKGAK